jgi:muconolactone delta-isomerase
MEYLVVGRPLHRVKSKHIIKNARAGIEYRKGLQDRGKIIYFANFTGRRGGLAIYDTASHEELHELLHDDPMYRYMRFEVTPLTSGDKVLEIMEKVHRD